MHGIFAYICHKNELNVRKYTVRPMDPSWVYVCYENSMFGDHFIWICESNVPTFPGFQNNSERGDDGDGSPYII